MVSRRPFNKEEKQKLENQITEEVDSILTEIDKKSIKQNTTINKRNLTDSILKRPNLINFIEESLAEKSVAKAVKGEKHSKFTALLLCNAIPLGLKFMIVFKGSSSIGKTNLANLITGLFKTKKIGELSPTAIKYSGDFYYDILYYQETSEKESGRNSFKFISSDDGGFSAETTVKNRETGEFEIQKTEVPAKGFVTTTTAIEPDKEFLTRSFVIPLDESENQTKNVMKHNFSETERKLSELEGKTKFGVKYSRLKDALGELKQYDVAIPFESELKYVFPANNMPLRIRRDSKKLMTLIKASALLFQYQRPKIVINDHVFLVATWHDFFYALRIALPILNATITGFDARIQKAIDLLPKIILKHGGITSNNLANAMGNISQNYAGRILKSLNDSGIVYENSELKKELKVRGKTKVYSLNNKKNGESCINSWQDLDWLKIINKQNTFLDSYRAKCKNSKYNLLNERTISEFNFYSNIVFDPIDMKFKKLNLIGEKMQLAALNSEEQEELETIFNRKYGCVDSVQHCNIEAPTAIADHEYQLGWWNNPMFETLLEAEESILKLVENSSHVNHEGLIKIETIENILFSEFDYGKAQVRSIIEQLKIEGLLLEPIKGFIQLNTPAIGYNEERTLIADLD